MPSLLKRFTERTSNKNKQSLAPVSNKELNKLLVKFVGFTTSLGQSRAEFVFPEHDLDEIKRAAAADSYIKAALSKYSYLIFKAGYHYSSDSDKAIDYIKMRLKLMSIATRTPTDVLFQEVADDVVKYSNCFLAKSRGELVYPGVNATGIFSKHPVLGYFRIDPTTIKIKRNEHGKIISYVQTTDSGEEYIFKPEDMIHIFMDREAGNAYGTPRISSALEDVKLLRRIEGNVLALIYRYAIPIIHFKVGANNGAQASGSQKEIDDLKYEVERMPIDGMIFTNERTEVKAVGVDGTALDTSPSLKYFESRVFTALGVSESQMGRGGAKQDADSMEAQVHDVAKYIQKTIATFINNEMFFELLLEGGFDPIRNPEHCVNMVFNELSLDTKVKVENHEILKYQSNVITADEVRVSLGLRTDIDDKKLYAHYIDENVQKAIQNNEHKNSIDTLKVTKALDTDTTNEGGSDYVKKENGNGSTKTLTSKTKDVENRNRPENQHGKTSVKIKESYLDKDLSKTKKKENHEKNYQEIYKTYTNLRNDIIESKSDMDILFPIALDTFKNNMKHIIEMASLEGLQLFDKDYAKSGFKTIELKANYSISKLLEDANKDIENLLKDIQKHCKEKDVTSVFDSLEYRLRFILEFYPRKSLWYTYAKLAEANDVDRLYVIYSSESDKEKYPSIIDTKSFSLGDIPPYHSFCNCRLSLKEGEE